MMDDAKTVTISVRISARLKAKLDRAAVRIGYKRDKPYPVSALIRDALTEKVSAILGETKTRK